MKRPHSKLVAWVRAMRGRRIGVVGDFMLDHYVWGTATRLSPEAAVPVVDFAEESESLGGAGNVASNLAALGAKVEAFGVRGADPAGERLAGCLEAAGIGRRGLVTDAARVTTLKTRIIARHQQVVRVDRETRSPVAPSIEEKLITQIAGALKGSSGKRSRRGRLDALVISDYDKGVVTEEVARRVLSACAKLRVPAFVKPKWSMLATYPGATVIVLNSAEAGFLVTRPVDDDESAEFAGAELLEKFKTTAVVLTRGARGMAVFEQQAAGRGFFIPAVSQEMPFGTRLAGHAAGSQGRQVFDVTGAGDTVLATLALAVAAGAPVREAAKLGNAAAGIVVGKLGTATVSPDELLAALHELV
jgi:D-beta-D-heptose 7-phosphate kinase/D-beta-D-heptose 1-phosphate adenosyltransferase